MSLILKQNLLTNASGLEIWVTDATLQYAASVNPGGWGSPNLALNQTALLCFATLWIVSEDGTTSVNTPLIPLNSAIAYSSANTDATVQSIGFNYQTDGHYTSVLMALGVSTNDTTYLSGGTIAVNDFYYKAGAIYQKTSGGPVLITDYSIPAATPAVVKVTSDMMFFNKLSIKNQLEYYRNYRNARNLNDPDLANSIRNIMDDLKIDLSGAIWNFAAGNIRTAENIVDELLEKHCISPLPQPTV